MRHCYASIDGVSVTNTLTTLIQLVAAANRAIRVTRLEIYFGGTSSTAEPVDVFLKRQSGAGTSSALTPLKMDDSVAEAIVTTALKTFTAEPTDGDILFVAHVHPQQGLIWSPPCDLIVGGGDRLGLLGLAPSSVACNAGIYFEE